MADTLFAPMAPMWPALSGPGPGWFQSPIPAGNRPTTVNGMTADTMGFTNGAFLGPGLAARIPPVVPSPLAAATYPTFDSPEIGPSAANALVAAIAVRRGLPMGPTNDQETEDLICDALDLLPGASDVEVRCENGRITLTGSVQHKRVKRDVGEIAWAIPSINDVQNNVTIVPRRRSRTAPIREAEPSASVGSGRKQT